MVSSGKDSPIIIVEGNIGAGKSTFLKILKEDLGLDIIFEPTNKWQQASEGGNLLDLFYKDTPRWAYTFQSYAFITRVQALIEHQRQNNSTGIQVLERSVYCDRYCFAKNCYESGLMSKLEWHIYKEWFAWLVDGYTPRPSGFIYLQTSPQTCFDRIGKRDRSEESGIPLNYLKALHDRHEDWLVHKKNVAASLTHIPVLTLDCDTEFETDTVVKKQHLDAVQEFITTKIKPITITPAKSFEASAK